MPKVTMSWNSVDSEPRRSFGASSAKYAGVRAEAAPTGETQDDAGAHHHRESGGGGAQA